MDADFLKILVCPQTHQSLREATEAELQALNDLVAAGSVKNQAGTAVAEALQAGLIREDGQMIYPVRDEIPILLAEEAIPLTNQTA